MRLVSVLLTSSASLSAPLDLAVVLYWLVPIVAAAALETELKPAHQTASHHMFLRSCFQEHKYLSESQC